jgi:hypothetical protein
LDALVVCRTGRGCGAAVPDLITRRTVTRRRDEANLADRLAVLLHRTLTTDGGLPGKRIPG